MYSKRCRSRLRLASGHSVLFPIVRAFSKRGRPPIGGGPTFPSTIASQRLSRVVPNRSRVRSKEPYALAPQTYRLTSGTLQLSDVTRLNYRAHPSVRSKAPIGKLGQWETQIKTKRSELGQYRRATLFRLAGLSLKFDSEQFPDGLKSLNSLIDYINVLAIRRDHPHIGLESVVEKHERVAPESQLTLSKGIFA
jgi:hypothetical protein